MNDLITIVKLKEYWDNKAEILKTIDDKDLKKYLNEAWNLVNYYTYNRLNNDRIVKSNFEKQCCQKAIFEATFFLILSDNSNDINGDDNINKVKLGNLSIEKKYINRFVEEKKHPNPIIKTIGLQAKTWLFRTRLISMKMLPKDYPDASKRVGNDT